MTEAGWQNHLDQYPPDPLTRHAYADWLEERGRDDEAYVQRWLGKEGRGVSADRLYPYRLSYSGRWVWLSLPDVIRKALPYGNHDGCYATRHEAEAALLCVLPVIRRYEQRLLRARQRREEKKWEAACRHVEQLESMSFLRDD